MLPVIICLELATDQFQPSPPPSPHGIIGKSFPHTKSRHSSHNGIIFPFIVTLTPRWCKYCCISGRGDGALRRHFCQSHYTSDNLPTSTLGIWVHGERPTDDMIRDVGVALARKCCCAGNPSSHYSSSPIFPSLPTLYLL